MEERFKTFTVLIARISRSIRRIKTEEVAELHLKSPHVSCLYYLYKGKGLTAKELCDVCDEDKAAISRSIEYLVKEGFVVRGEEENKRYKTHLTLTQKGEAAAESIVEKIDGILDEAGAGLSEADRMNFYKSLALISENLQKICDEYEK